MPMRQTTTCSVSCRFFADDTTNAEIGIAFLLASLLGENLVHSFLYSVIVLVMVLLVLSLVPTTTDDGNRTCSSLRCLFSEAKVHKDATIGWR